MGFLTSLEPKYIVLVAGLASGWLVLLLTAHLLVRRTWNTPRVRGIVIGLTICSIALLGIDFLESLNSRFSGFVRALTSFGCVSVLLALGLAFFKLLPHLRFDLPPHKNFSVGLIVFVCIGVVVACTSRLQVQSQDAMTPFLAPPGNVETDIAKFGVTDQGRRIDLYHFHVTGSVADYQRGVDSSYEAFQTSLIKRSDLNTSSNCHGWVFASGDYLILSRDVEAILYDNGYAIISEPQVNDIAIYRTSNGVVNHTALVCAVLSDGSVLLESKWGIDQRFIHLPDNQPYSKHYDFYRTSRGSHTIHIYEGETDS
jgi:hypothetical protein